MMFCPKYFYKMMKCFNLLTFLFLSNDDKIINFENYEYIIIM